MDGHARVWSAGGTATIDVGADESQRGTWYVIELAADPLYCAVNETSTVTATVKNPLTSLGVPGLRVNVSLDCGTLLSISSGWVTSETSGYAYTDDDGEVTAAVTRDTPGKLTVTATCWPSSIGEGPVSRSVAVRFYTLASMMNWPMFMHDAQHTGMSPHPDTVSEGGLTTPAWVADVPTADTDRTDVWSDHNQPGDCWIFEHPYIDSSPVVMGNKVVVGEWTGGQYGGSDPDYHPYEPSTSTGCVKAFNGETGKDGEGQPGPVWIATGSPAMGGVASTPCIYNGKVYVGSANGYLYCLDLDDGDQYWANPTHDRDYDEQHPDEHLSKIIASPVVHDGIVYIGNEAARVYAFNADEQGSVASGWPSTGIELPIYDHGIPDNTNTRNMTGVSSPAVATVGDTSYLLFGCDDGYLYRITISGGQVLTTAVNLGGCVESSPTVVDDEVFVGVSLEGPYNVYRLSVDPLQVMEHRNLLHEIRATLAFDGRDFLYGGVDTGETFHRLRIGDLSDSVQWFRDPYQYFVGSGAVCRNGLTYVGNDSGVFWALYVDQFGRLDDYASYNYGSGFICSSPAIAYDVEANHDRWVYVTTRAGGGKLLAFRQAQ